MLFFEYNNEADRAETHQQSSMGWFECPQTTMKLRRLLHDDDAVSPVIGVILMVAITVTLAAVIVTFVRGLGEQVSETSPNASFTLGYNESVGGPDCRCW